MRRACEGRVEYVWRARGNRAVGLGAGTLVLVRAAAAARLLQQHLDVLTY